MIWLTVLIVWFIGYLFSVHPIYTALIRGHLEHKKTADTYRSRELSQSDVFMGMLGATVLGLVWFAAAPYLFSHFVYSRRKPSLEREVEIFEDEYKYKAELKKRLKDAHKAIEAETKEWHYPNR